ncbi:FtsW/RodA/SpoVE family cell cycle protein [Arsenicicoccus dermatophilus]|uniref:FtsW/RodA/SpoVE family cell cycle protein n=1 Tax=Arsenicicoccus dermatophilus TaxID=1076331 RepID=UPI001F4D0AA6|nr:FtsW/RodA/SpoVE family cell cycle protein [Arsenicicoccus dermatophilus]MCH8614058.1 FtsW/RodA/SpoVE family cell cycle protein [Arsenicicoccus dermatophilus]
MTTVSSYRPRTGRTIELGLIVLAVGLIMLAYANVGLKTAGALPTDMLTNGAGLLGIGVAFNLALRWRAPYADPLLVPISILLNGLGLVMIHRIDLEHTRDGILAPHQLMWSFVSVLCAIGLLVWLRDHRRLRRYTYTFMAAGALLLVLPLLPFIGDPHYGSRIWIRIGPFGLQPGEIAKIVLAIFFAGYLVQTRDVLSLVGRRVLGFPLPRARDLGPILMAWAFSLCILIFEKDLGSSLLFFGLFVAVLYVATERVSWIALGLLMFCGGAYIAWLLFDHVQQRVNLWFDPFYKGLTQVGMGIMGMASGGLLGAGLGGGHPEITPFAKSDYIIASLGEELGLFGLFAILALYAILVERGLRTAVGVRDGFGKLLAAGLAFGMALQVFVIVGGLTRVIPLTGLTTPFLSAGGSSLIANWSIVALLLRISDQARRPIDEGDTAGMPAAAEVTQVVSPR